MMRARGARRGVVLAWASVILGVLAGCSSVKTSPSSGAATGGPSGGSPAGPSAPSAPPAAGLLFSSMMIDGQARPYAIYVPRDYPDSLHRWPLVVFLHGRGECGTDGVRQTAVGLGPALLRAPERWPFLVLMPQKPTQESAWADHEAMVMAMLDRVLSAWRADPDRVYLTGLSQGGAGTWMIGAAHPDRFAALAPVCGYADPERVVAPLRHVPIWTFHGQRDDVIPIDRTERIVSALRARQGDAAHAVRFTVYPDANHNAWDRAYAEDLASWFLAHRLRDRRP
jgi:predicted peptidase